MELNNSNRKVEITKEIAQLIVPLRPEEFQQLELNILSEGCRDPLIVWEGPNRKLILLDGHNRLRICQEHNQDYQIKILTFEDYTEAKFWMINNQLGRRNLNPDQMSYYRGLKYNNIKNSRGGIEKVRSKGQTTAPTSIRLANEFNISQSTIKRDSRFAIGLNIIGQSNPSLKKNILTGKSKVNKNDIQLLADAENPSSVVIKNEADLYNKAKLIRENTQSQLEQERSSIREEKVKKAQEILAAKDPMFLGKEERISQLKGRIISVINRSIREKDSGKLNELTELINRLAKAIAMD